MIARHFFRLSTLAWIIFSLAIIFTIVGLWIYIQTRGVDVGPRWGPRYFTAAIALGFGPMALLILIRQPANRIGWFYIGVGLMSSLQLLLENYAVLALLAGNNSFPLGNLTAWIASWIWVPFTVLSLTLLPLIFPDGRLVSRGWRNLFWTDIVYMLTLLLVVAFNAGPMTNFTYRENPFGVIVFDRTGRYIYNTQLFHFIQFPLLPIVLASVASVFVRLKRSTGIEHQQLKWFAYAGAGLFVGTIGGFIGQLLGGLYYVIGPLLLITSLMAIPIITGMAILRYRLWDIDLLIRRTLQYTLVTGLLVVTYVVSIILLQNLVTWVSGQQSQLVVVATTLMIAGLFSPVRFRVQDFIDRRFYRNKYTSEAILAEFASVSRNEMDINRLSATILRITDATIQPAHLSLWLKKINLR